MPRVTNNNFKLGGRAMNDEITKKLVWYLVRQEIKRDLIKNGFPCQLRSDILVCWTPTPTIYMDQVERQKKEVLKLIPEFLSIEEEKEGNYADGYTYKIKVSLPKK